MYTNTTLSSSPFGNTASPNSIGQFFQSNYDAIQESDLSDHSSRSSMSDTQERDLSDEESIFLVPEDLSSNFFGDVFGSINWPAPFVPTSMIANRDLQREYSFFCDFSKPDVSEQLLHLSNVQADLSTPSTPTPSPKYQLKKKFPKKIKKIKKPAQRKRKISTTAIVEPVFFNENNVGSSSHWLSERDYVFYLSIASISMAFLYKADDGNNITQEGSLFFTKVDKKSEEPRKNSKEWINCGRRKEDKTKTNDLRIFYRKNKHDTTLRKRIFVHKKYPGVALHHIVRAVRQRSPYE